MPYRTVRLKSGKVRVVSPHGTKSKATTLAKAKRQLRLLRGLKHGWRPTGAG